ncbi:hypothetical protein JXB02_02885 [Candidatus Woesearchaeota archaeon]|nr:hypothetical protein [Candidatus Woesearchaeota archaeon]
MKCAICKAGIGETFLKKMIGTIIKDAKGKRYPVCPACQQKHQNDKKEMLKAL